MNEKIKEIIVKSNIDIRGHYDESGNTPQQLQEFAELIVKECIDSANNVHMCRDGQVVAEDIKKHFGIVYYTQEDLDAAQDRGVELAKKLRVE